MSQDRENMQRGLSTKELKKTFSQACRLKTTDWLDPYFLAPAMSFCLLTVHFIGLCVIHAFSKHISQTQVLAYFLYTLWTLSTFLLWIARETYQEVRRFMEEGVVNMSDVICAGLAKVTAIVSEVSLMERKDFVRARRLELKVSEARSKVTAIVAGVLVSLLQVLTSDSASKSPIVIKLHLVAAACLLLATAASALIANLKKRVELMRLIDAVDASINTAQSAEKDS